MIPSAAPAPAPRAEADDMDDVLRLFAAGRYAECQRLCLLLLDRDPARGEVWARVAHIAEREGRWEDALVFFAQAALRLPNPAEIEANMGVIRQRAGDLARAHAHYARAYELGLRHPTLLSNLATMLLHRGEIERPVAMFREALALDERSAHARISLGYALCLQGRSTEGMSRFREALAIDPDLVEAHDNLLFGAQCCDGVAPDTSIEDARRYGALMRRLHPPRPRRVRHPDPDRPLRVGFVSADLRQHAVAYFLEPLVTARDRSAFQYTAYAQVAVPDATTARLREQFDGWRSIVGVSDDDVLAQIERDEIDVLVDLAGHTAYNRLRLFARRAAPVQVAYLGYPGTTGLDTIDFRITDAVADPPGLTDRLFTEALVRMPGGFLCYRPPEHAPAAREKPPCALGRPFTFGSFNNWAKTSPTTLALWRRVLQAAPGARLLLKSVVLRDQASVRAVKRSVVEAGLPADRVHLDPPCPAERDHLAAYLEIDVALDTFPYGGTTTTCEALWMGVPVVTLTGDVHAARVGASLLPQVGLSELVAATATDYIAIAAALASDPARLQELRRALRDRVARSPLTDGPARARDFEQALRSCWQTVVGQHGGAG